MSDKNQLYTSHFYDFQIRGTTNDIAAVNIYTDRNHFSVRKDVSFDTENKNITSIEYFAGSVLSSILLVLIEHFKKSRIELNELEGVSKIVLANPLSLIGVRGYSEEPFIEKMEIKIYVSSDLEKEEAVRQCQKAVNNSPIVNTVKKSTALHVNFKIMDY